MDFIEPCFGIGHNLSLICQMTSEHIKHQLIIIITDAYEFRSCVKVEVAVLGFPSLIVLMVSVDIKQH